MSNLRGFYEFVRGLQVKPYGFRLKGFKRLKCSSRYRSEF